MCIRDRVSIAQRHLLPKLLKRYGLKKTQIKVRDAVYTKIIQGYTREAGVRDLERNLDKICRKALQFLVEQNKNSVTITEKNLETYLGSPIYFGDTALSGNEIGLVNGLAWTSVGGDILRIEACVMGGSGKLEMTGRLGEVMRESAHIEMCIRDRAWPSKEERARTMTWSWALTVSSIPSRISWSARRPARNAK